MNESRQGRQTPAPILTKRGGVPQHAILPPLPGLLAASDSGSHR